LDEDAGSDVSCGGIEASIDVVSDGEGHHCLTGNCCEVGAESYDDVIVDDVTVGAKHIGDSPIREGERTTVRRHYEADPEVIEQDVNHVKSPHSRESPQITTCQTGSSSPTLSTDFRSPIVERFPIYGSVSAGRYHPTTSSSNAGCDVMNERHQTASSYIRNDFTSPSTHGSRDVNHGMLLAEVCETMSRMRRSLQEEHSTGQFDSML